MFEQKNLGTGFGQCNIFKPDCCYSSGGNSVVISSMFGAATILYGGITVLSPVLCTQSTYSVGPPSAHQRNAVGMVFRWRADGDPLSDVYWVLFCPICCLFLLV